ncbi:slr1659 superfamily regulator [Beggiatoa leptomitoformis]|uniref:STAS domain-containing protein n=1 Tax=Beggiatoa leptomitoformis TaxID=288004 RepID=A0A2N9YBV9_9GAMM|nr:hypothetical protein [Beggiatoa leptomitoformis]ALG66711.1 hypothetical protein AL038_01965 [Beggiatoa leptomitoformis]AUI67958.1 hypothetical protein BLE401_04075 [Beggiatoa leptomitoformis]
MQIKTDDYDIAFDTVTNVITCKGSLLLSGSDEYAPLLDLMNNATEQPIEMLTLDVRALEFLNSSGINTMTKFVINVRNKKSLQLTVVGYEQVPWQVRLLKNLQRLMPTLVLQLE